MEITNENISALDFEKGEGLVPVIVQNATSNLVLMLGYMNEEALVHTLDTGKVTFYSRSKQRLWTKGETSENYLHLVSVKADCDRDALLILADPEGPTCHTGDTSCFGNKHSGLGFLAQLGDVIADRHENPSDQSYTTSLFRKGIDKIAQKVGEEAVELVIEAKNDKKDLFLGEAADLIYHLMVLLEYKKIPLEEVIGILQERHQ